MTLYTPHATQVSLLSQQKHVHCAITVCKCAFCGNCDQPPPPQQGIISECEITETYQEDFKLSKTCKKGNKRYIIKQNTIKS